MMAVQGATLAPLTPSRPLISKTNVLTQLYSLSKYNLNPALRNGGVSLHVLSGSRGLPKISMRLASKQAYICRDCGYIYNDKTPFEKLPDSFYCPVCGAPKRRFRSYEKSVSKNVNETSVRKARKEDLKRDENAGIYLTATLVIGITAFVAAYFYLDSQFVP